MREDRVVGIDVGASSVKGGLVDPASGWYDGRIERDTAPVRTPLALLRQVAGMAGELGGAGPVGVALPGVIRAGVVTEATNLHPRWAGFPARTALEDAVGRAVVVLNDADAAGIAEMRCGAAVGVDGQVLVLTFGTGIGSALFESGVLVQRLELGRLPVEGRAGELRAAAQVKEREGLSWTGWVRRVQRFLEVVETVCDPDLLVLGGGISRDYDEWGHHLRVRTPVRPARFRDSAGLVGAALYAHDMLARSRGDE